MPLLLSTDSWAERLFKSTFHWEFKCSACKAASKEWVNKTLSTCTNLVPGWHPLHAVHKAPCNVCGSKNQSRTMTLVSVPPVFALHFVEGLPDGDVGVYSFDFKGKHYSVTTVIQYDLYLKHFVTWTRDADGSWLEYDDLEHPHCKAHKNLAVPAQELHILFWEEEEEEGKESRACSPSSTFTEAFPSEGEKFSRLNDTDSGAEELVASDHSVVAPHDDTDIVCAFSTLNGSVLMDTTVTAERDTSISANTLLDTFEGLSHDDIVTLTLVELNNASDTQPSSNSQQTPKESLPRRNEAITSTSDSANVEIGSSSETDSGNNLSSDPTYEPGVRRGRGRGRGVTCSKTTNVQRSKKAASSKAAARPPAAASTQPPSVTSVVPMDPAPQSNTTHVEDSQQTSAVSSTNALPPSTTRGAPNVLPFLEPNSHWSYLLQKRPQNHLQKSHANLAATTFTQLRPVPPVHSTPVAVKRPQAPAAALYLKVPLGTEEGDGHPLKAAEMYGGFGAKSSSSHTALKPHPPVTSNHLTTPAVMSATSLQPHGAKKQPENSKLLPSLSSTDALRHKLLKKLKAKKKKLARLNKLLGVEGGASLQPDSTDLCSPSTVSSSTYDGSAYDDILSDLLSPATTASNLSPDSTEFLEMLANGKDGAEQPDCAAPVLQMNCGSNKPDTENFLDEFLSQAEARRPTDMETEALSALELFI